MTIILPGFFDSEANPLKRAHKSVVHDGFRFECDKCDRKYTSKTMLNMHIETVHERNRYECEFCNKSFLFKISLTKTCGH